MPVRIRQQFIQLGRDKSAALSEEDISFFTVPKAFTGHVATIQRNAMRSWKKIGKDVDVVLFGNEKGVAEAAEQFQVRHVPQVACNEYGTPLLNSVFEQIQRLSSRSYLCFVNADIILLRDFIEAAQAIPFKNFLMLGQRWDCNITEDLNDSHSDTDLFIRELLKTEGVLHPPAGSDYFVFPRDIAWQLPAFAVGRPTWDNWLIYRARTIGLPVVDATAVATVIHQNHDYGHVPSALDHSSWEGPEADRNRHLGTSAGRIFTLADATHIVLPNKMKTVRRARYLPWVAHGAMSVLGLSPWLRTKMSGSNRFFQPKRRRP